MLGVYYDLAISPATYDIVAFLTLVERTRRERGEDQVAISFLPGPANGFRHDRFWPFNVKMRLQMLHHVAVPMAWMLPGVAQVSVLTQRPMSGHGALGYRERLYGLQVQVETMRSGVRPLRPVTPLPGLGLDQRRLVTITLREAAHWPERNSDVPAWLVAAQCIAKRGFEVRFVRDTRFADEPIAGFDTSPRASRELEYRAHLYRAAACNLFVNNGPAWFALALDAPVLMLKPTFEGLMKTCSAEYFRGCGIEPGQQIDSAPPYQRIAWTDDREGQILLAFDQFLAEQPELLHA